MRVDTLDLSPALQHSEQMAQPVAVALKDLVTTEIVQVAAIDPELSDTAAFCQKYGVRIDQAANCIVLEARRGERSWYAACVILGSTRADINGAARRALDAHRVSFAPMERAVALTGMEYGAITPVGLPADWSILIDKAVADSDYVIIGSGMRRSKLAVPGSLLASLPNASVIDGLASPRIIV